MSEFGVFDPEKFTLGGFLDGKEGRIEEARFGTFDYAGTVDPPAHVLSVKIIRLKDGVEDGDRTEKYGIGQCRANDDGLGFTGIPSKACKAFKFLKALAASGFPMKELNARGAEALDGALFSWKHIPVKGSDNDFAVPDKYLGTDGVTEEAAKEADDFLSMLHTLVRERLTADGPMKKLAIQKAVSPSLNGHPNKTKGLSLLVSDTFYADIDGISCDAGVYSIKA
jgi:hypothetical protein